MDRAARSAATWYVYVDRAARSAALSMHGIRPQGHSYAQVTALHYMIPMYRLQLHMICLICTGYSLTWYALHLLLCYCSCLTYSVQCSYWPLFLGGLRFMPRRYTQTDRRCSSEVGKLPLFWSVAESACYAMMSHSKLETLQIESWVFGSQFVLWNKFCTVTYFI